MTWFFFPRWNSSRNLWICWANKICLIWKTKTTFNFFSFISLPDIFLLFWLSWISLRHQEGRVYCMRTGQEDEAGLERLHGHICCCHHWWHQEHSHFSILPAIYSWCQQSSSFSSLWIMGYVPKELVPLGLLLTMARACSTEDGAISSRVYPSSAPGREGLRCS